MGRINWDNFLEPPDEPEIKVCECAACDDNLYAGDEVVSDPHTGNHFCNMGCARNFVQGNVDIYGPDVEIALAGMTLITLEEPEPDYDDRED